jgi:phage gpG-like protein
MTDNSLQQVNEIFRKLKEKGIPTQPLMQKIAGHLEENVHENLLTEGSGSPTPWAPLSPAYAKQKAKKRSLVQKILTSSGALDQSIFQRATELEAAAGTNKIYGRAHQLGAEITHFGRSELFNRNRKKSGKFKKGTTPGRGKTYKQYIVKIPVRPFLYLTPHYRDLIINDVSNYYSHL